VPTPFYHLSLAEDLLQQPTLPEMTRKLLSRQRGAFLFGNTAPDVQTISGQARATTHFFDVPIQSERPLPWDALLAAHPGLARVERLTLAQAVFIAGYLCHLQADWWWVVEIFTPVFGPGCRWESLKRRLYLHNVLRAYLDQRVLQALPVTTGMYLGQAAPVGWLPFVSDPHLKQWREFLFTQLQPGAAIQTVEVFAARQGVAPDEYYHLINSETLMEQTVFTRLPRQRLEAYRQRVLAENVRLLQSYLGHYFLAPRQTPVASWQICGPG
jgi:hypothetical protein